MSSAADSGEVVGAGPPDVVMDTEGKGSTDEEEPTPVVKGKGKGKSKGKGKGKAKAVEQAGASGEEEAAKGEATKNAKNKKRVIAKEAVWNDLPDWGTRTDCPLLERLPLEVLDRCFGLRDELHPRDYVALAGTCRFFRHHMDEAFFDELCYAKKVVEVVQSSAWAILGEPRPPPMPPLWGTTNIKAPFTRAVAEWRVEKPRIKLTVPDPAPYFIPPGDRAEWTQDDYERYKVEKKAWRANEWARLDADAATEAKAAAEKRKKFQRGAEKIWDGGVSRTVKGVILGRRDGEPAVEKDQWGLPLQDKGVPAQPLAGAETAAVETEVPARSAIEDGKKRKQTKRGATSQASSGAHKKLKRATPWTAPDTDSESDREEGPKYDRYSGEEKVFDHWPSRGRDRVAEWINIYRISKTEAMERYKVTEAQLITLKHYLVSNPMNSSYPKQLFLNSAVEALALRAHGGVYGHEQHMDKSRARSDKARQTRAAKIAKAKANGTYVPPKPKILPWERYRPELDWMLDDFFDALMDGDECACPVCLGF